MEQYQFIVSDTAILGGKPVIKGTRISVGLVLEWLAGGATPDKITELYPQIHRDAVMECIRYAADAFNSTDQMVIPRVA